MIVSPNTTEQHMARACPWARLPLPLALPLLNKGATIELPPTSSGYSSMMDNVAEEKRRTLTFIADLLNEHTRGVALLELSKKREQVPELALILWHSFGMII
jgi:hypothetical protein